MTRLRVCLVDDHATFTRALALLLADDPDVEVVGTASNGDEAVRLAVELRPDVILMDIDMPSVDGVAATRRIVADAPHVSVVMLTMFDDDERVRAAVGNGARGYLLKGARKDEIVRAVRAAHEGEAIFGPAVARRLGGLLGGAPERRSVFPELTERELAVLDLVAAGLDNRTVAAELFLSEKTVRNYVSTIFSKLQVSSRSEAVVRAREEGLGGAGRRS